MPHSGELKRDDFLLKGKAKTCSKNFPAKNGKAVGLAEDNGLGSVTAAEAHELRQGAMGQPDNSRDENVVGSTLTGAVTQEGDAGHLAGFADELSKWPGSEFGDASV